MAKTQAFAIWVTGLPASGKSTLVRALAAQLAECGVDAAVLESDALRAIFTPHANYSDQERDLFYAQMLYVGALLVRHGVPVIFDATANRRRYREDARREIQRFVEVFVDAPLETCVARDPKGIYRQAREGKAGSVPGMQSEYEPPLNAEIVVRGDRENAEAAARRIIEQLRARGYVQVTQV